MEGYTEDDTFDALRRIPVRELEKRLADWRVTLIEDNELRRHSVVMLNRKEMRRQRWMGWLTPDHGPVLMNEKIFDIVSGPPGIYEGTGWTHESYVAHIRKLIQQRQEENDAVDKIIRREQMIGIGIWAAIALPVQIFIPLPTSILSAIAVGFMSSYIMTYFHQKHAGKKKYGPLRRD